MNSLCILSNGNKTELNWKWIFQWSSCIFGFYIIPFLFIIDFLGWPARLQVFFDFPIRAFYSSHIPQMKNVCITYYPQPSPPFSWTIALFFLFRFLFRFPSSISMTSVCDSMLAMMMMVMLMMIMMMGTRIQLRQEYIHPATFLLYF